MTNDKENVVVGKPAVTGGILCAPIGTTSPTDESTVLGQSFKSVGYLGDSGFSRSEAPSSSLTKAWGGDPLVTIVESTEFTAQFALAEYLNPLTQQLIYGAENVTVTAATTTAGNKLAIRGKSVASPRSLWVIEVFSGKAKGRLVFPDAQITDREDVTYSDAEISARGVTLALFPDTDGNYFYEYWDDGRKVLVA